MQPEQDFSASMCTFGTDANGQPMNLGSSLVDEVEFVGGYIETVFTRIGQAVQE